MKNCIVCKNNFTLDCFHKNKTRKDGVSETCKECAKKRAREWRANNLSRASENHKKWRKNNIEHLKEYFNEWYEDGGKIKVIESTKKSRKNHPERHRAYAINSARKYRSTEEFKIKSKEETINRKLKIISHYSNGQNKCDCCNESHIEFLSVDHVNGGGNKHRKEIKNFYSWIIKNNFPEGFRILCMNCNFSIGKYGFCPHKPI